MKLNRKVRRLMAAHADEVAGDLARTCFDFDDAGKLVPVRDARAVEVLETAFAAMLRNGGEPVVIQITEDAASAFPRQRRLGGGPIVKPWLAVGFDRAGQATYAMQRIGTIGLPPAEEKDLAEVAMLTALGRGLNVAGFPGKARGRVRW